MNTFFDGDNLPILQGHIPDQLGDLVCLDLPFSVLP